MEDFRLRHHLSDALALLGSNTMVLGALGLIAGASALSALSRGTWLELPLSLLSASLAIAAPPVIYGIYYHLSTDSCTSVKAIAVTYLPSYLWLLARMYLPVLFLAGLPLLLSADPAGEAWFHLTVVSFSLLYLYVIPYFYHSGRQNGAITGGIHFLRRHIAASTPMILAVLLLEAMILILQQNREMLLEAGPLVFVALDFFVSLAAAVGDVMVFLMLIFILREQAEAEDKP